MNGQTLNKTLGKELLVDAIIRVQYILLRTPDGASDGGRIKLQKKYKNIKCIKPVSAVSKGSCSTSCLWAKRTQFVLIPVHCQKQLQCLNDTSLEKIKSPQRLCRLWANRSMVVNRLWVRKCTRFTGRHRRFLSHQPHQAVDST